VPAQDVPLTIEKPGVPPTTTSTPGEGKVWVQLADGGVREPGMSEIKGTIRPGRPLEPPKGQDGLFKMGDPPHSRQVRHGPVKPLFSPEELNEPVPREKGDN
jgi:hypothetical protein